MADIPTPRSRSQIVGEMVDALLARLGLPALKVGSPALSIIEAAAQSDFRSSQDIFGLLNSLSLDRATGQALDRIGQDEGVVRQTRTAAAGTLTIGDSSFSKIATPIYQGGPAPIIGSTTIKVQDALLFPNSGSIYIGRGTGNYEGPLSYTAKANAGSYWTLTLASGTTKFHNLGESVILAQGGTRNIPAGTVVRTAQGNASSAVQFSTTFAASIPDGEVEITNVPATAREPGSIGKAVTGAVVEFVTAPFAGATVTNEAPFANGYDTEDDQSYRDRIRQARQSRTKGTELAIESGVVGISALDENKRVLSASLVSRTAAEPATLYIDDGTGYEEQTEGIAYEALTESAIGGEQYFQLESGRPVAKAFVTTSLTAPFVLTELSTLSVEVGGVRTTHRFQSSEFRSLGAASAIEIVAAINANPNLLWVARTADAGTKVSLSAKADSNEQIQVVGAAVGDIDANDNLGFSTALASSLWLYKNDLLLNKDGRPATLTTKPNTLWTPIVAGATLDIAVDGIALTVTINDVDFVNAGTPYVAVSQANDLPSWAKVFNSKIPGVTTTVSGSSLVLTSNKGNSASASIAITGGTLATAMFDDVSATGADSDYTLDRNLGQIRLDEPLEAGDRLTAGSFATRSFVESTAITSLTVAAEDTSVTGESGAEFWVVADGSTELIPTLVGPGTSVQVTLNASPAWGDRVRIESSGTASLFTGVRAGDWLIATDSAFNVANRGAYRIVRVASTAPYSWVEIEQPSAWASTQAAFTLANGGLKVVRTSAIPQRVFLSTAGNPYTPQTLATSIQSQLRGATASTYRTNRVRIRSNTFNSGDLAVVAANNGGVALGFYIGTPTTSGISHLSSALANNRQNGTPQFFGSYNLSSVTSTTVVNFASDSEVPVGSIVEALKTLPESSGNTGLRWGNDNFHTTIASRAGAVLTFRDPVVKQWLPGQRFAVLAPYGITARDALSLTLDEDTVTKRHTMNMYRKAKPTTNTYGASNYFTDADNGNVSLAQAFGTGFNWTDFAIHMKARALAQGVLWRYYRHGSEGNYARIAYTYPAAASTAVGLTTDSRSASLTNINVSLASGAARTLSSVRATSYIGSARTASDAPNDLSTYTYIFNLPVASGSRQIRLNYTNLVGAPPAGLITGASSGATATTISDGGTYVVVGAPMGGTFFNGEAISWAGGSATTTSSQYGHTTLTLTTPGAIDHGLTVGTPVWLQSSDVNFVTGTKVVTAVTASTISYTDAATITAAIAGTLTISRDSAGEVTLTGSSTVAGDILSLNGTPRRLLTVAGANDSVTFQQPVSGALSTVVTWIPVVNTTNLSIFPLNAGANSTANIISSVNALNGSVSGFESAAGTISYASYEAPPNGLGNANSGVGPWYPLKDGLNYVQSHNTPVLPANNFQFTFKAAIEPSLATGTDWENEDVRIVPITAANVARYLNSPAVGGLFSGAEIALADQARRAQITTNTAGSYGAIQVDGGGADSATAAVVGSAATVSNTCVIAVASSEADALTGEVWVAIDNAVPAPKPVFTSATALTAINGTGLVHTSGTKVWKYVQDVADALTTGQNWHVERQGRFVAFVYNGAAALDGFSSVREGDWVAIDPRSVDSSYAANGTMNALNRGLFRVIRTSDDVATGTKTFWIENANAVEENATVDVAFLDINSVLPGDSLIINTSLWGATNIGEWKVARINMSNQNQFYVDISTKAPAAATAAALGASSGLIQLYEANPTRLIKKVQSIAPYGSLTDVRLGSSAGASFINSSYGSVLSALDKLDLGAGPNVLGTDGYSRSSGLIAEANKVVYGYEAQSSTYPGIAAAGARINIMGPRVRRIQVNLTIRTKSGVNLTDIQDYVRSAVASTVNESKVGSPIAISDIVAAAQRVNGVVAVSVASPTYNTSNDLIPVQPYEKALINDIEQDVKISFVGD